MPDLRVHRQNRAQASGLKVYPPNNTTATVVPFQFLACAKSGPAVLSIRTTAARTGIPSVSS